jgi:hypothetical protein
MLNNRTKLKGFQQWTPYCKLGKISLPSFPEELVEIGNSEEHPACCREIFLCAQIFVPKAIDQ